MQGFGFQGGVVPGRGGWKNRRLMSRCKRRMDRKLPRSQRGKRGAGSRAKGASYAQGCPRKMGIRCAGEAGGVFCVSLLPWFCISGIAGVGSPQKTPERRCSGFLCLEVGDLPFGGWVARKSLKLSGF